MDNSYLYYDPTRNYRGMWDSLFNQRDTFTGPQSNWIGALDSRMNERFQGKNIAGKYEGTLRNLKDHQRQVVERNHIIESMYRAGYSKNQIAQHLGGTQNIADQAADYSSRQYYKDKYGEQLPQEFLMSFYGGTGNTPHPKNTPHANNTPPANRDTITSDRQGMFSPEAMARRQALISLLGF